MKCIVLTMGYAHLGPCSGPVGKHGRCMKHLEELIRRERDLLEDELEKAKHTQERLTSLRADRKALREKTP